MRTQNKFNLRATGQKCFALFFSALFMLLVIHSPMDITAQANPKYAGIVVDAKTGKVLYARSADKLLYPASLTKMMTLYMLFDAMEQGKVSKKTRIRFSKHSSSMQPSKLGLKPGQTISAEQAIYALVTKSANDVAAAVGEHLGGTESQFAVLMTRKARSIGMKRTTFKNASGLPNKKQVTTARDMATLGIALREHFPRYYKYFSTRSFKYGKRRYGNHNRLLDKVRGMDGIKTGYTRASGFNLVTSVQDRKRSIVAVVMGGKTGRSRNAQMAKIIKKYLPRASRGKDKIIVAKAPKTSIFKILKNKKKNVISIPANEIQIVQAGMNNIGAGQLPIPAKNPATSIDPVVTAMVKPTEDLTNSNNTYVEAKNASGWQVQISAVPSKNLAIKQLNKVRKTGPKILLQTTNYTETVTKNGTVLYRARFTGFSSKNSARKTCAALKRQKVSCLALLN